MSTLISLKPSDSSLNPVATFDYPPISCYFLNFLPDLSDVSGATIITGIKYSYYSTKPNITIKQNSKLRDINLFYSSSFVIVKRIHEFTDVRHKDLEMIIEHIPDPKNTNQCNLYTCFPFSDISGSTDNSGNLGFDDLFAYINADNIDANTKNLTNASLDQLKIAKKEISLTGGILKNLSNPSLAPVTPDAFHYLDNSMNIFIVFNHTIQIRVNNPKSIPANVTNNPTNPSSYLRLRDELFTPVESNKIFKETDCKINTKTGGLIVFKTFSDKPIPESFATLSEGFASLREGATTITTGNTLIGDKYMYCRPSDSSNSDKLLTTTINASANIKKDSILLNDVMMIFIIMILLIFMCILSPAMFLTMNKNITKYDTGTMFWALRIVAFIIVFCGGLLTIIVATSDPKTPEWLSLVGLILVLCYILYYLVVYSFQKNTIYTQLTDLVEETFEEDEKEKIKTFRNKLFGEVI